MKKKVLISVLLLSVLFITGCEKDKKENKVKYDYSVLVNKYTKLPDDWEDNVELVSATDAWGDEVKLEKETYEKYQELKKALEEEGIFIELDSIYRSVKEQQDLWDRWTVEKGIDYVKKYVAVPGYSEHHTGLAVDICIKKDGEIIADNDAMIKEKEIFSKIHDKLADYGFILRYLKGKDEITGYSYEPWHLRYIGNTDIAKEITSKGLTYEEYLNTVTDLKNNNTAAIYHIEKALQEKFKDVYKNKITNSRFNVKKIYTDAEIKDSVDLVLLNLNESDIPFVVEYEVMPKKGVDVNSLTTKDGEYDKETGWVKKLTRVGVLKQTSSGKYEIANFGTSF